MSRDVGYEEDGTTGRKRNVVIEVTRKFGGWDVLSKNGNSANSAELRGQYALLERARVAENTRRPQRAERTGLEA